MTIETVDLPIDSMVLFHSYVNVYQRISKYMAVVNPIVNHPPKLYHKWNKPSKYGWSIIVYPLVN